MRVAIVGGGIFGLAAAGALARRGHAVELFEAGSIPSPKGSSTDVSKALRMEYGAQSHRWAPRVSRARELWLDLQARRGRTIFHEAGFLGLCTQFEPGVFEYDSYRWLADAGYSVSLLSPDEAAARFGALSMEGVEVCTFNPQAGWLDPMQALPALAADAEDHGAQIHTGAPVSDPAELAADAVLLCAGPWLRRLLPEAFCPLRTTQQHESLFRPAAPERFADRLPVWSFDLAGAGLYGFPLHPDGFVKIALHRPELDADPDVARASVPAQAEQITELGCERIPELKGAAQDGRSCLYTMTPDGEFIFDALPGAPGHFVAGGGSGHAFKFGPLLGEWAADLVEGRPVPPEFRAAGRAAGRVV